MGVGVGDVAADPLHRGRPTGDHLGDGGAHVRQRLDRAVDDDDARDLGVPAGQPHRQRAAHREAGDHDPFARAARSA